MNGTIASPAFARDNPAIPAAVFAAQQEANAFIAAHPGDAASIYVLLQKDTHGEGATETMIVDPDIIWTTVPQNCRRLQHSCATSGG